MILKHVHLFGILLLSLLLASFLGKFLNNGKSKEGLFEDGSDDSGYDGLTAPINAHTGGSSVAIETFSFSSPDDQRRHLQEESAHTPQTSITTTTADTIFGGAFDTVLPSEKYGNSIEPFIAPFVSEFDLPFTRKRMAVEGLANGEDDDDLDGRGPATMGISRDQIPPGQEHLYVLKSQVVPPTTCPVCPSSSTRDSATGPGSADSGGGGNSNSSDDSSSGLSNGLGAAFNGAISSSHQSNSGGSKCPPCPACARCPEPSFECKKVPNYAIGQNGAMSIPRPVLADFSQFGM